MKPTTQHALDKMIKQVATYQPPKKTTTAKRPPKAKAGKK